MLLQKFDYQSICRLNGGDKEKAFSKMKTSFNFYFKKRCNFIARARAKSCIHVMRRLKESIDRKNMNKFRCGCKFESYTSNTIILCADCSNLPCHNLGRTIYDDT